MLINDLRGNLLVSKESFKSLPAKSGQVAENTVPLQEKLKHEAAKSFLSRLPLIMCTMAAMPGSWTELTLGRLGRRSRL